LNKIRRFAEIARIRVKAGIYAKKFVAGFAVKNGRFFVVFEQQILSLGVKTTPLLRFCISFIRPGGLDVTNDRLDL
jgi:hypothetical protein